MSFLDSDSSGVERCGKTPRWKRVLSRLMRFGRRVGSTAQALAEVEIRRKNVEIEVQETKSNISNMCTTNEELRRIFASETSESEKKLQLAVVFAANPNLLSTWRTVESLSKPALHLTKVVIIERIDIVLRSDRRSAETFAVAMRPAMPQTDQSETVGREPHVTQDWIVRALP